MRWTGEAAAAQNPLGRSLMRIPLAVLALTLAATPALAGQTSGPYALALAGLVAPHHPGMNATDRATVARLFAGDEHIQYPAGRTIAVTADKIVCRVSNVEITARSCELTFGKQTVNLTGPAANALFATLASVGIQSEGAAGSIFEGLSALSCKLTPSVIVANGGGGADCSYALSP
jgi:hypothetical protein